MLEVEQHAGVSVLRMRHDKVNALDLELLLGRAQRMAQTSAGVYAASKRQLQQPARDRIAGRRGDDADVLATWSSDATQAAIAAYPGTLRQRR